MNVTAVYEASSMGHRDKMQDVTYCDYDAMGTLYMGVFDGHGEYGHIIAKQVAQIVRESIENAVSSENIQDCTNTVANGFQAAHRALLEEEMAMVSGTTATVAVVNQEYLATVYVGDSEAVFFPDSGHPIALTKPHNKDNVAEVKRATELGFPPRGQHFGGMLAVSRAIGDICRPFVTPKPDITMLSLSQSGVLVVASDGLWGTSARSNHVAVETAVAVQRIAHMRNLPRILVAFGGQRTRDNATAIVARIE